MSTVFTSDLRSVQRFRQGKVRDIYAVDDEHLLIVATDRLSGALMLFCRLPFLIRGWDSHCHVEFLVCAYGNASAQ